MTSLFFFSVSSKQLFTCLGLIFSLFCCTFNNSYAQQDTALISLKTDSTGKEQDVQVSKEHIKKKKNQLKYSSSHSPKKAVLYGLIPGGGQIYNKKYWKLPIVYGGIGGLGYLVINNRIQYQCYRKAYLAEVDSDPSTVNECNDLLNVGQLKIRRDAYLRQYEYAVLGFVGFYALTLLDAFVDAHLMQFDISDDLSLNWRPKLHYNPIPFKKQTYGLGLYLSIQLHQPQTLEPYAHF